MLGILIMIVYTDMNIKALGTNDASIIDEKLWLD
jgi:hypothetical protein